MDKLNAPLLMNPFYSYRPWGGDLLKTRLGKPTPAEGGPFGEAWELSDHPDGRSHVANGPLAGQLFGEAVRQHPRELLGLDVAPDRYPLLVKYIDASQDLSVQVHPTNETAPAGDRGKTECWYIMHAEPGAVMCLGLAEGVDAARLQQAARAGGQALVDAIRRVPIQTGDFVYIPAGTVHATMAGTLLCEVQQSSNTTYRIYDWDRQPARPLHIDDAVRVTHYTEPPAVLKVRELPGGVWNRLIRNAYFEVRTVRCEAGTSIGWSEGNAHGQIICIPEGGGTLTTADGMQLTLALGQTWFLPAGIDGWSVKAGTDGLRVLLSWSNEL